MRNEPSGGAIPDRASTADSTRGPREYDLLYRTRRHTFGLVFDNICDGYIVYVGRVWRVLRAGDLRAGDIDFHLMLLLTG